MQKLVRLIAMVSVLATSTHVFADSTTKAPLTQAEGEKLLAFVTKVVATVIRNDGKCPEMGAALNKLIDANRELVRLATEPTATARKPPKNIEDKMAAKTKEMMPALQKCSSDKTVAKAFGRLQPRKS